MGDRQREGLVGQEVGHDRAHRPHAPCEKYGAIAAEYRKWRELSSAVRSTIGIQPKPLATYPTAANCELRRTRRRSSRPLRSARARPLVALRPNTKPKPIDREGHAQAVDHQLVARSAHVQSSCATPAACDLSLTGGCYCATRADDRHGQATRTPALLLARSGVRAQNSSLRSMMNCRPIPEGVVSNAELRPARARAPRHRPCALRHPVRRVRPAAGTHRGRVVLQDHPEVQRLERTSCSARAASRSRKSARSSPSTTST